MHAPMTLTNTWFIRLRARAMTINSAAYGLGGVLLAPILGMIVHSWGWRWGAAIAGMAFLADRPPALPDHSQLAREHGSAPGRETNKPLHRSTNKVSARPLPKPK